MASISSLCFARSLDAKMQETKGGAYVYAGEAWNFHEWEFRTLLKARALHTIDTQTRSSRTARPAHIDGEAGTNVPRSSRSARSGLNAGSQDDGEISDNTEDTVTEDSRPRRNAQDLSTAVTRVVEGLRGDAFDVARDLGEEVLCAENGLIALVDAMRTSVFPLKAQEAKELFKQGTKPGGLLSRQAGESMTSYVSRRKRWWRLLTHLDHEIMLSDAHRADLLLDLSGLDANQRLMLMSSIQNNRSFSLIAEALVIQHSAIHRRESRAGGSSKAHGKDSWRSRKAYSTANIATNSYQADYDEYDEFADHLDHIDNDPAHKDSEEEDTYAKEADSDLLDEIDDEHEACQLNVLTDVIEEFEEDALQDVGYVSTLVQAEATAMLLWGKRGKGKGKHKGKKKGAKASSYFGAHQGKGGYPIKRSTLSLEDRRKKLKELKAKSQCKRCGETGHWQGDPECKAKRSPQQPTARFAAAAAYHSHEDCQGVRANRFRLLEEADVKFTCLVATVKTLNFDKFADSEIIALPDTPLRHMMSDSPTGAFPDVAHPRDDLSEDLHFSVEGHETKITWGKYRGKTYGYVLQHATTYYVWGRRQKNPSQQLMHYLDWCDLYYRVDKDGNIAWRQDHDQADMAQADNASISRGVPPAMESCQICSNFDRKGSNAWQDRFTCRDCGKVTSYPRAERTHDPESCPHTDTDHRGSGPRLHRTFCKMCQTCICRDPTG